MIESNNKISAQQLFCILLLSRISSEIVYPRSFSASAEQSVTAVILAELARFLLALPIIIYSFKGSSFHAAVLKKNRFFGWAGAFISAGLLVSAALRTLFFSSEFAVKNLLVGGSMWAVFTISAIFAVYAAAMGTEAVSRAGAIILIAAALITGAVVLADIPYMQLSAVGFSANMNFTDFLGEIWERILRGGDYLIFSALLPFVDREKTNAAGKSVLWFAGISALVSVFLCLVSILTLREMYGLSEYPFITAASLSDVAFFKRLDGAAAAVWLLCAVFRAGLMLLSAERVIAQVGRASKYRSAPANGE